jgi:hypothetical protein
MSAAHERVQIGVFAARGGWLRAHDHGETRFDDADEALEAALRLAHVERWRGRAPELVVQEVDGRLRQALVRH